MRSKLLEIGYFCKTWLCAFEILCYHMNHQKQIYIMQIYLGGIFEVLAVVFALVPQPTEVIK